MARTRLLLKKTGHPDTCAGPVYVEPTVGPSKILGLSEGHCGCWILKKCGKFLRFIADFFICAHEAVIILGATLKDEVL